MKAKWFTLALVLVVSLFVMACEERSVGPVQTARSLGGAAIDCQSARGTNAAHPA